MPPQPPWLVQVYKMTDAATQVTVADLLAMSGACAVDGRTCERGSFLIVECPPEDALTVYELVVMTDFDAELIHSTTGPRQEPVAVNS